MAIGNPFGLGSSLTVGYVSAVGRTIPSGATPFAIPHAIQTDAAINPGNSGGPLLDMDGNVIGVNAQIATGGSGSQANAGVGFAIPASVVSRVAPVLIEAGSYSWPWLGVQGIISVDLFVQEANNLPTQQGVYIHEVVPGGPAEKAGLEGSTGSTTVEGFELPTGGDVIVAINDDTTEDDSDLLLQISQQEPGDTVTVTVLRDGEELQLDVTLEPRPSNF
jgi:2-alkenal reductase